MTKSTRLVGLRSPLAERSRRVNWDLYDFEGTQAARSPGSCWQNVRVPAGERYQSLGEERQLRHTLDLVGSLRHGWRRHRGRAQELVETSVAEYQHDALQFGLTTPHREFWGLETADSLVLDRWKMTDRLRGLHLLVVEVDQVVGFVPLDEATPWHLALAYPLLGYLPPDLRLDPWAEAVLHLDVPNIRRIREAWVEKHRRAVHRAQQMIRDAQAWVPEPIEMRIHVP
jgi:hypothetical protein